MLLNPMMPRPELERIYDDHATSAFALFCQFTRNEADARDLLQDWLVKIGRGFDALPEVENERAYLLKIARRQAIDWDRRQQTRRKYHDAFRSELPTLFAPDTDPDRNAMRQALETAVANLPEDQREVAKLKLWDGLTLAEIADLLDLSINTVGSRYRYAIEKLREQLHPYFNELRSS